MHSKLVSSLVYALSLLNDVPTCTVVLCDGCAQMMHCINIANETGGNYNIVQFISAAWMHVLAIYYLALALSGLCQMRVQEPTKVNELTRDNVNKVLCYFCKHVWGLPLQIIIAGTNCMTSTMKLTMLFAKILGALLQYVLYACHTLQSFLQPS